MLRGSCLMSRLTSIFSFFTQYPHPLVCWNCRYRSPFCCYNTSFNVKYILNRNTAGSFSVDKNAHLSTLGQTATSLVECSERVPVISRKAEHESPAGVLKHKLSGCSKDGDVVQALKLYDEARNNGVALNLYHYNSLLYLCSLHASVKIDLESDANTLNLGLKRGFEIFQQMLADTVVPNEATFTSAARLAAAKEDPEMAFELLKQMKILGIPPKLRSYEPALFGFCKRGDTEKAYAVDADMIASGIMAEEPELSALLKLSVDAKKEDKVYEMLHRLPATVRQVQNQLFKLLKIGSTLKLQQRLGKNTGMLIR